MIMPNNIFVRNFEIVRVDLTRFLGPMIGSGAGRYEYVLADL